MVTVTTPHCDANRFTLDNFLITRLDGPLIRAKIRRDKSDDQNTVSMCDTFYDTGLFLR